MKLTFTLIVLFFSVELMAQKAGTLDSSFGQQGKLLETTANNPTPLYSVITKDDGKILAGTGDANNFIIKQFLSDGTPDSAFGVNGNAEAIFYNQFGALLYPIDLTGNNEIVAAGYSLGFSGPHFTDILLVKFLESGKPDMNFGDSGKVVFDFGIDEYVHCMKVFFNRSVSSPTET